MLTLKVLCVTKVHTNSTKTLWHLPTEDDIEIRETGMFFQGKPLVKKSERTGLDRSCDVWEIESHDPEYPVSALYLDAPVSPLISKEALREHAEKTIERARKSRERRGL